MLFHCLFRGDIAIGMGHEIEVIAAVIIGGTSLFGGRGNLIGTIIGALILSILNNAVIMLRLDFWWGFCVIDFT